MLHRSNMTNTILNITGCLFFHDGKFVQFLEGEEEKVRPLFNLIKTDNRHKEIVLLSTETTKNRLFNDWSVVYHNNGINGDQARKKRILFESIYHSSNASHVPGNSKLVLWYTVQKILNEESVSFNGRRR